MCVHPIGLSQGSAHLDCNVLLSTLPSTDVNIKLIDIIVQAPSSVTNSFMVFVNK